MKMQDLKVHHSYRLTADVKNPSPDRRSKDWNLAPVLPAGTILIVRGGDADSYFLLHERVGRGRDEPTHTQLGKLLLENLEEIPDTDPTAFAYRLSSMYGYQDRGEIRTVRTLVERYPLWAPAIEAAFKEEYEKIE